MSAGTFIAATMKLSTPALEQLDLAANADEHSIPLAWVTEYRLRELQGRGWHTVDKPTEQGKLL